MIVQGIVFAICPVNIDILIINSTLYRDYYVHRIPHSNLIILTLSKNCHCQKNNNLAKLEPKHIIYNNSEMCSLFKAEYFRKRLDSCLNYHIKVSFA